MSNLQEFIDYVWSFYNPQSELYPIKGLTKKTLLWRHTNNEMGS